jgi:hypothetical protein
VEVTLVKAATLLRKANSINSSMGTFKVRESLT